jgi:very-short-patch-repair endonuclease
VCEVVSGLREAKGYGAFSIGVVTPFKPQKEQIQSELERRGLLRDITVDTVHRFQGDERDVMIFSPVVSRAMSEGAKRWVEYPHNLINVAVTRARESFYFVADYDECRIRPGILGRLTRYVETVESLRKSSEAELSLFTEMVTQGWNPDVHVQIGDIKVDFVLERFGRRIAIEVDGEQHKHQAVQDEGRDAFLLGLGYRVLRVPARDVFETPALVIRKIDELLTEDLEVKTPKRGTSATSAADGVSRDDIDLFDERWQPLIENLLEDANIVVEPGCDVLADGRVVGQSLAIVSDGSHQLHLLDGDHPDSRRVRDYLEEQGEHVLVCRSPGIETAHQIRARLHGNDI